MTIKSGAGKTEGDKYQIWLGISLVKDWIISGETLEDRRKNWLEEEVGQDKAGIFDDIAVYDKNVLCFYQVKHTINIRGDLILLDNLLASNYEISIGKMCKSFEKIKNSFDVENYKLIIYSNKHADNQLREILDTNGQFIPTIKKLSSRAGERNREIIKKLIESYDGRQELLKELLQHLYFNLNKENIEELENKVRKEIDSPELLNAIKTLVDKSHKEKYFKVEFPKVEYYLKKYPPTLPFLTSYMDYFEFYLNEAKLLNHTYEIVGRGDEINGLIKFLESNKRIYLLVGRGGSGKSKILYEFSKRCEIDFQDWSLYFVKDRPSFSSKYFKKIINDKVILLVDDAHRRDDIQDILAFLRDNKKPLKLILSLRPIKIDYLKSILTITSFELNDYDFSEELSDLSQQDLRKIAEQVVGKNNDDIIDFLLSKGSGIPLVIIVGGKLIVEHSLNPNLLIRSEEFQRTVFDRYYNEIIGDISEKIEKEKCRNVLSLISILSPIILEERVIQEQLTTFLELKVSEFNTIINELEKTGILYRKGLIIKIIPDVLSDYILYDATITDKGQPKGYIEEIIDYFSKKFLKNILINVSELDWLTKQEGLRLNLIDSIWNIVDNKFENSSNSDRVIILKLIKEIAFYQPERVLTLIEYAINNPSNIPEEEHPFSKLYEFSHDSVLHEIPSLLKEVSLHINHLKKCCDLLWNLGRDDDTKSFFLVENAMKVLSDIARIEPNRKFSHYNIVLNCVDQWSKEDNAFNYINSPIEILNSILIKEGTTHRLVENTVRVKPYIVSYQKVKSLREKAISILKYHIQSNNIKAIYNALEILLNTLYPPRGVFGRSISSEEIEQWTNEQNEILDIIESYLERSPNSIILLFIMRELAFISKILSQSQLKIIQDIMISIPKTFELSLVQSIWNNYPKFHDVNNYKERENLINKEIKKFVRPFLRKYDDAKKVLDCLEFYIEKFYNIGIQPYPENFLKELALVDENIAKDLFHRIKKGESKYFDDYINIFISIFRTKNYNLSIKLIAEIVDSGNHPRILSILRGYRLDGWISNFTDDDILILSEILKIKDIQILKEGINILGRIPSKWKDYIFKIINEIEQLHDERIGEALAEFIYLRMENYNEEFSDDDDLRILLEKYLFMNEIKIESYFTLKFLEVCCNRIPEDVINLFIERIKLYDSINKNKYIPIPFTGYRNVLGKIISQFSKHKDILEKIKNFILELDDNKLKFAYLLFIEISNHFSQESLDVLNDWIKQEEVRKLLHVGGIIAFAPANFVFGNFKLVSRLIEISFKKGEDYYKQIRSFLIGSATGGLFFGSVKSKYNNIIEKCEDVIQRSPTESKTYAFFNELLDHAKKSIEEFESLNEF